MSESGMWSRLRPVLACLDPVRIEDRVGLGTPDVNFIPGWLELKRIKHWPKTLDGIVRLEHFTPVQRTWLTRRHNANEALMQQFNVQCPNSRVWVLLHVERTDEWLLFDGLTAAIYLGKVMQAHLRRAAVRVFHGLPTTELLDLFRR